MYQIIPAQAYFCYKNTCFICINIKYNKTAKYTIIKHPKKYKFKQNTDK